MRDKLIHDYIGVDLWAVWGVVENIIPTLKTQIEDIIKKEKSNKITSAKINTVKNCSKKMLLMFLNESKSLPVAGINPKAQCPKEYTAKIQTQTKRQTQTDKKE